MTWLNERTPTAFDQVVGHGLRGSFERVSEIHVALVNQHLKLKHLILDLEN